MFLAISKCTLACMLLTGCTDPGSWPKHAFGATEWANTPEESRYVFARALTDQKVLQGKTMVEVKQLLGTPSFQDEANRYVTYVVKTGGREFDQVYVLDIRFNSVSGTVESVGIRGD